MRRRRLSTKRAARLIFWSASVAGCGAKSFSCVIDLCSFALVLQPEIEFPVRALVVSCWSIFVVHFVQAGLLSLRQTSAEPSR